MPKTNTLRQPADDIPSLPDTEGLDSIPINDNVALIRRVRNALADDLRYCSSFLNSPLANENPALDKTFKQLLARAERLRAALEKIDSLNPGDEELEAHLRAIAQAA